MEANKHFVLPEMPSGYWNNYRKTMAEKNRGKTNKLISWLFHGAFVIGLLAALFFYANILRQHTGNSVVDDGIGFGIAAGVVLCVVAGLVAGTATMVWVVKILLKKGEINRY